MQWRVFVVATQISAREEARLSSTIGDDPGAGQVLPARREKPTRLLRLLILRAPAWNFSTRNLVVGVQVLLFEAWNVGSQLDC